MKNILIVLAGAVIIGILVGIIINALGIETTPLQTGILMVIIMLIIQICKVIRNMLNCIIK